MTTYIEKHLEEMIDQLGTLIAIPSLLTEDATPGAPFGTPIAKALEAVKNLGLAFGLTVKEYDGYALELTLGEGDHMVGILCHVDVVSPGNGWNYPPFELTRVGDNLYGRGTMDDKGPIISALYAMKYLQETNKIPANTCIRMIIGTDEEDSWGCINHYTKHADRLPNVSIVPDADFPAIYCEKGLLDFNLTIEKAVDADAPLKLESLTGGNGRNIVPDYAECHISCETPSAYTQLFETSDTLTLEIIDGVIVLKAYGKSAHCMNPEKGISAITLLMTALDKLGDHLSHHELVHAYMSHGLGDYTGEACHIKMEDTLSGALTFNIGIATLKETCLHLTCNVRYPASLTDVAITIQTTFESFGMNYEWIDLLMPIYFEKDHPLIANLLEAYESVTGETNTEPFAIGGATYARALPNAVAFGPKFPWEEELAHEPDEYLSIESFKKMTMIYGHALEKLLQL